MIIKLKDLLNEELYNSQGEGYTFGKGDIVKDINPDCPHHGAEGEVIKGGKVKITFRVTNNGKNFKEGDELEKTTDQMVKLNSDEIKEGKLNENKAGEYEKLRKNFEKTYKAYWDAVYDYEQGLKKQGLKKEAMTVHRKYMKNVLGFHAWMRQWIRKVY